MSDLVTIARSTGSKMPRVYLALENAVVCYEATVYRHASRPGKLGAGIARSMRWAYRLIGSSILKIGCAAGGHFRATQADARHAACAMFGQMSPRDDPKPFILITKPDRARIAFSLMIRESRGQFGITMEYFSC